MRKHELHVHPLRRALQKCIGDPPSEALIQGTITMRLAFIELFLEDNKLYYRPVDVEKTEEVLLYEKPTRFSYQPPVENWRLLFLVGR
jgi:hypothetical protein